MVEELEREWRAWRRLRIWNERVAELVERVSASVIESRFATLSRADTREKSPGELVTDADVEGERLLTAGLRGCGQTCLSWARRRARPIRGSSIQLMARETSLWGRRSGR